MPGLYNIVTRRPSELITALIYNGDMQAHVDGRTATLVQSFGASRSQFITTTDPYPGATPNLAPSMAGELARLRFVIAQLKSLLGGGVVVNWYDPMTAPGLPIVGARVQRSTSQAISNNTQTVVNFTGGTAEFNGGAVWEGVTHPTRFTAPATGFYQAFVSLVWDALDPDGVRNVQLGVNGTFDQFLSTDTLGGSSVGQHQAGAMVLKLAATDYVEFRVFQDSGSTLHLVNDTSQSIVGGIVFLGSLP